MNTKTVELHLLQNFPPSCVNRDGNNSPKDCTFGDVRRARISSQCLKRAIRDADIFQTTVGRHAVRTRELVRRISQLVDEVGIDANPKTETLKRVKAAFEGAGMKFKEPKKEQGDDPSADEWTGSLLVYLGDDAATNLAKIFKGSSTQDQLQQAVVEEILTNVQIPEIALYGRMLAIEGKTPLGKLNLNSDAAVQVAHAISTHKLSQEMDYWTAVDSYKPKATPGAGMLGTAEFNASTFYRYACINHPALNRNLNNEDELAKKTIEAFLLASYEAIPTGKLNGHAHYCPPLFALATVRTRGMPMNLANAFLSPVRMTHDGDLATGSAKALLGHLTSMRNMVPIDEAVYVMAHVLGGGISCDGVEQVSGYNELILRVMELLG